MFNKNNQKQNNYKEMQKETPKPKKRVFYNPQRSPSKIQKKEIYTKIEWPKMVCEKCGKEIKDLNTALSDKNTGNPVHFDCILNFIKSSEEVKENEEVVYIGNGSFAIVVFENPRIRKKFKIIKYIEWEEKNKKYQWRDEIKQLASST